MKDKCERCYIEKDDFLPGIKFEWLEGSPFICDRCFARVLGISTNWTSLIVDKIQERIKQAKATKSPRKK